MILEQMPVDDDLMTDAEMRVMSDFLGLSGPQLATVMGVHDRTVRRWENSETGIPDGVAEDFEALEARTADAVGRAVEEILAANGEVRVATYASDEDFWAAEPHMRPLPARWDRMVVARVAQEVPGLRIVFRGRTGDRRA